MGGMPSCRGLEWKGAPGGGSRANFDQGFDAIPKDKDGKFIEPKPGSLQAQVKPIPCRNGSWVNGVPGEVGGMTTVPQMDTYWKKLCSIILGNNTQVAEHLIVDKKELEKFMMYIEDPVWRKRNVLHSNLVNVGDAEQSNIYQILQGVNQIKEKFGI